jgi:hypothetical protein
MELYSLSALPVRVVVGAAVTAHDTSKGKAGAVVAEKVACVPTGALARGLVAATAAAAAKKQQEEDEVHDECILSRLVRCPSVAGSPLPLHLFLVF